MDLNEITAGTYLLVARSWEEYLSKPGQPFDFRRHKRGAILDLNVEDARRLVSAGAVIPYDRENPTHLVNADGSISEIQKVDPAATGLVITQEQLDELGLGVDATSEDVVRALAGFKDFVDAAQAQAEAQGQAIAEAQRLAAEAEQARAEAEARATAAEATAAQAPVDRPKSDQIKDILEWVGSDQEKAAIALEGERSTKGDKARPNLVGPLEEIVTAPPVGGGA